ncbi:uncharacterized protein RBU33_021561 isoform 2-T2 [Hipposideros larvatus]
MPGRQQPEVSCESVSSHHMSTSNPPVICSEEEPKSFYEHSRPHPVWPGHGHWSNLKWAGSLCSEAQGVHQRHYCLFPRSLPGPEVSAATIPPCWCDAEAAVNRMLKKVLSAWIFIGPSLLVAVLDNISRLLNHHS